MTVSICLGDCLDHLRAMADASIDSIVTDPPYGLGFMAKKWDYDVPSVEIWAECLRVLKPGGHLLAFAGTRTQHRMAVRIEDAGFEIRDMIAWVYGSGFPKSHDVSKSIDKAAGAATEEAAQWSGWGTALEPALEPITVARKPLMGTVVENVFRHGTGALNIDGCRVPVEDSAYARNCSGDRGHSRTRGLDDTGATDLRPGGGTAAAGRWPANLIHDGSDEVLAALPQAKGAQAPVKGTEPSRTGGDGTNVYGTYSGNRPPSDRRDGGGSAARFFYCAKASKADRDDGLDQFAAWSSAGSEFRPSYGEGAERGEDGTPFGRWSPQKNHHPTVKPTDLMRYLCRLVTPNGGVVLDPFMGSGSTGRGAVLEGFGFVGIEREEDFVQIARARIAAASRDAGMPDVDIEGLSVEVRAPRAPKPASGQLDLFSSPEAAE